MKGHPDEAILSWPHICSSKQRKDSSYSQVSFMKANLLPHWVFDGSLRTHTALLCDHWQAACGCRLSAARGPRPWSCPPGLSRCSASRTSLHQMGVDAAKVHRTPVTHIPSLSRLLSSYWTPWISLLEIPDIAYGVCIKPFPRSILLRGPQT